MPLISDFLKVIYLFIWVGQYDPSTFILEEKLIKY